MKRSLIALGALAALLMLSSPALAQGQAGCSFIGQLSEMVGQNLQGNTCASTSSPVAGAGPVVATSEPLAALAVGLGLLGARLLRRRS
jgi:MYXO-CTERM domain-containing protein